MTSRGRKAGRGVCAALPRRAARNDGVGEDQEFSRAGNECDFVLLSGGSQATVERDQLGVPSKRGWERRHVKGIAQSLTASCDMADALPLAAVIIVRGKPGEGGNLSATEAARSPAIAPGWRPLCVARCR